jgi:hypothetical protein
LLNVQRGYCSVSKKVNRVRWILSVFKHGFFPSNKLLKHNRTE